MKKISLLCLLLFLHILLPAQDHSAREADSLETLLRKAATPPARAELLFELAVLFMHKPGEEKQDLERAENYMRQSGKLAESIGLPDYTGYQTLLHSYMARERGLDSNGKSLAIQAVSILEKGKNLTYLGKAYFAMSEYYDYGREAELEEKIRLVNLACKALAGGTDRMYYGYRLGFLADLYNLKHDRARALATLDEALKIYQEEKFPRLSGVYILYASIYFDEGNYKKSLSFALDALKDAQKAKDSSMTLCQINNRVGMTLTILKEYEKSIGYFQDALETAKKHNDNNSVLMIMVNTVNSYILLNQPDKALRLVRSIPKKLLEPRSDESFILVPLSYLRIYSAMEDYTTAQHYGDEIARIIVRHPPMSGMLNNYYLNMARISIATRQFPAAEKYIFRMDSLSRKMGDPDRIKTVYFTRFSLDTALGRYKSAVENLLAFRAINDSLYNESITNQIKQLEIEYETAKTKDELKIRDQNIMVLQQNNTLQTNAADKARLVRNLTIAGIVIITLFAMLLLRNYRVKQRDNATIVKQNEQLQHLVREKEWLVTEIHHRVKNNFHIVTSLLDIQSNYLRHEEARVAIKESQNRIHSMSLIHQKLYQSEKFSEIDMPEYIVELVEFLRDSFGIRDRIQFETRVDAIRLNHAQAITIGLILNEAITNSIKYAFDKGSPAMITIRLYMPAPGQYELVIADNGRGLPAGFNQANNTTMGMELLQGLAGDISGSFELSGENGTAIRIRFPQVV